MCSHCAFLQVSVTTADLPRLEPGEFLNDTIIDFYLRYIQRSEVSAHRRDQVYIFSSFFYSKLAACAKDELGNNKSIHRWTRNVDIFNYRYLVVPVNDKYVPIELCHYYHNESH